MKIFFSVGEPSGDLHGANLIRALRRNQPDLETVGYGGPKMAAAGCQLHCDLTQLAIIGFFQVFVHIRRFWRLLRDADNYFRLQQPDAVVMIDYPGFNWWIARKAKARGIPVVYYGVPQMWGWAGWRVKKMRRLVDHALCKLPFEAKWYQQRGCNATYVGHPYFDELRDRQLNEAFIQRMSQEPGRLVTILPGSRTQEVLNNTRWFLKAAQRIHEHDPQVRFAVACFNEKQRKIVDDAAADRSLPLTTYTGCTTELIQLAHSCLACSGSVSLELLYHEKPSVILYWVPRWFYEIGTRMGIRVKYITLVNILADEHPFADRRPVPFDRNSPGAERVPFPEYPTYEDKSFQLAEHVIEWLTDEQAHRQRIARLSAVKRDFCVSGASEKAASYILQCLPSKPADQSRAA